jgi:hypothetical protein
VVAQFVQLHSLKIKNANKTTMFYIKEHLIGSSKQKNCKGKKKSKSKENQLKPLNNLMV